MNEREKIKSMPGFEIHWACKRLLSCYHILIRNSHKLTEYCLYPHELEYSLLPNKFTRLQKNSLDSEVSRLLHNFVASVKTLVDISRIYSKKYLTPPLAKDYQKIVTFHFKKSHLPQFIFGLRNYILHCDMPTLGNSVDQPTSTSIYFFMIAKSLLEWNNWNKLPKIYLQEKLNEDGKIKIDEIVSDYIIKANITTQLLVSHIANSNAFDLESVYYRNEKLITNANKNGFITDPLIIDFYTRKNGYTWPTAKNLMTKS